jgi:hypothetical protein
MGFLIDLIKREYTINPLYVILGKLMQYLLMGIAKRPNMSALFTARIEPFSVQIVVIITS